MKRIINTITFLFLLSAFTLPAKAQKIYNGQITVNPRELSQKGDSLRVKVDFDCSSLEVDPDRSLTLIPVLVSDEAELELPYVLINGGRRHKVYERELSLNKQKRTVESQSSYGVVNVGGKTEKKVNYSVVLPFEDWMEHARLDVKEDLCGCAGKTEERSTENLFASVLMEEEPYYEMDLQYSFIRPEVEEIKKRSEQRDAFLDFRVAKTAIDPNYMNNPRELSKIESMLGEMRDDKNLTVHSVAIKGYASSEGSVSLNNKLSSGRAETLRSYLASRASFPAFAYRVEHGGEDWAGLEKLVDASQIEYKGDILSVIRSGQPEDLRENSLKSIGGGAVYKRLLSEYYPQLRRVVCRVDYTVRGFNVEEAKDIILSRPQQLSLEEMFLVANTYDIDDPAFTEVFETAVRLFPDDEVANLNAAASSLQSGNVERAKKYLDKSSITTGEYLNNMGGYYLLKGEFNKARDFFNRAAKKGNSNAEHNLKELEQKMKIEGLKF